MARVRQNSLCALINSEISLIAHSSQRVVRLVKSVVWHLVELEVRHRFIARTHEGQY